MAKATNPPEPSAANTRAVTDPATGEVVASVTDTSAPPAAPAPDPATAPTAVGDVGQAQVQAATDAAEAQGYFGTTPDPTPDSAYSVGGVISGAPTPETQPPA